MSVTAVTKDGANQYVDSLFANISMIGNFVGQELSAKDQKTALVHEAQPRFARDLHLDIELGSCYGRRLHGFIMPQEWTSHKICFDAEALAVTPWNCSETLTMKTDPALDAVRKARCDISRELGNDPVRLAAHYAELQARFKGRIIRGPEGDDSGERAVQTEIAGAVSANVKVAL